MSEPTVWAVRRLPHPQDIRERLQGPVVVATFASPADAEADRAVRDRTARAGDNPFDWPGAGLETLTSLDPGVFLDWLLDAGIEPPPEGEPGRRDWSGWLGEAESRWSDYQREKFWQALDGARRYEVVEQAPPRRAWVVIEIGWHWNDSPPLTADEEGGAAVRAFTSRDKAEAYRRRREAEKRRDWDCRGTFNRDARSRAQGAVECGDLTEAETPFFEIVEVDMET